MNIGEKYYCSRCMREIGQEKICPHCGYDPSSPMPGSQLEEGTLLDHGRYELGTMIGRDSFGITYSAWDLVLDIPVAIKEYFPAAYCERNPAETDAVSPRPDCGATYQLGLQAFVREANTLAVLQNARSAAKAYDCFEKNRTAYIVMEYMRNEAFRAYCRDHRPDEKTLPSPDIYALTALRGCAPSTEQCRETIDGRHGVLGESVDEDVLPEELP